MEILRPPCDVIDDVITVKKTLFGIICDDLFISEVKLKLCLKFQFFKMAAILSSQQAFLPEGIPEFEYTRKTAISISDIMNF